MYYINDFNFDPNLKYLIYFRGGFSPPTRGHWSLIEKYMHLDNVQFFIHQIGQRHGIPYHANRKVFQIYLKPVADKIVLEKMGSSLDVLDYIEDIDEVIYIKGAETPEPLNDKEARNIYRRMKDRYSDLYYKLRERKIKFHFLLIDRPKMKRLSATKFTEELAKINHLNNQDIKKLSYFIPKHVSHKDIEYIIRKFKKYI